MNMLSTGQHHSRQQAEAQSEYSVDPHVIEQRKKEPMSPRQISLNIGMCGDGAGTRHLGMCHQTCGALT